MCAGLVKFYGKHFDDVIIFFEVLYEKFIKELVFGFGVCYYILDR